MEQGLSFHLTHFRSFRRRWGVCSISQDCSRSQSPQCVRCWVVCVRPLLITVVCVCIIWKAWYLYVLDARLGLWASLEHAFATSSGLFSNTSMWERTYYVDINLLIVTSLVVFCQNSVCLKVILCIYYFGKCSSAKGWSCVQCRSSIYTWKEIILPVYRKISFSCFQAWNG